MEKSLFVERMYYTRKEVSIITGISVTGLCQLQKRGEGPRCFIPPGFSYFLYPISDMKLWLNAAGLDTPQTSSRGGARKRPDKPKLKGRPSKKDQVARRERSYRVARRKRRYDEDAAP